MVKDAKPCSVCGEYYPAGCKCDPCIGGEGGRLCDGCEYQSYHQEDVYEELYWGPSYDFAF